MRQERVEEDAVASQPVHPDDHAEPAAASPLAEQDHAAGLDVVQRPGPGRPRARARRPPARVDLGAQLPVAPDPVELAARRLVPLGLGQRRLRLGHLALQVADLAKALILAERGFDHAADRRLVANVLDQERHRAEAQAELAHDRLRGAVDHRERLLQAVPGVERDHALALGVDAPPAGPARHLGELVRRQRPESRGRCAS